MRTVLPTATMSPKGSIVAMAVSYPCKIPVSLPLSRSSPRFIVSSSRSNSQKPTSGRVSLSTSGVAITTKSASASLLGAISNRRMQAIEERIERVIYHFRFMTFLGVFGSLLGSILCFLKGCGYVIDSFAAYFSGGGKVMAALVEAIDIYLIGTVMLVFGMGLYELFISNMDIAKQSSQGSNLLGLFQLLERPKWLEIQSVNELKTKLGHVIVMVLLVGLFDKSKKVTICSPTDLLCFAASILLSSCGLYLLSKLHNSKTSQ